MPETFFDEQEEQSEVKSAIVANYFESWAKVIQGSLSKNGRAPKIAYVDLFAGPGRYKNGSKTTPLHILETALRNETLRKNLVTWFNDKDPENSSTLREEISKLENIGLMGFAPKINNKEIGSAIVKEFESMNLIPTLMFVDPWGYKGLSLKLINSVIKDWACECIFFFNYNRINAGLSNPTVKEHMESLFGEKRAAQLAEKLRLLNPVERELTVVEELCEALVEMGGKYVLPFRFKKIRGAGTGKRTSHHLIFVSKHPLGYKIMKNVMAHESSTNDGGVSSFEFNPATANQTLLFGLMRPLTDLEGLLEERFAGRTLSMEAIFNEHNCLTVGNRNNYMLPYTDKNYKSVLNQMELAGKIFASKPYSERPNRNGEKTFADHILVTFPSKRVTT